VGMLLTVIFTFIPLFGLRVSHPRAWYLIAVVLMIVFLYNWWVGYRTVTTMNRRLTGVA